MALITRFSRLFRADVHAVLDRLEEPDVLLRQSVREMEEALVAERRRQQLLNREAGQLGNRLAQVDSTLARIADELDVCFAADQPDLARGLIRRRLENERLTQQLKQRQQALAQELDELAQRIADQAERLEEMRQKAALLAESDDERSRTEPWNPADVRVRDEDVEVAFLREQQRRKSA